MLGLEWMMWITLLKKIQGMFLAYHRKWMGPMVEWHIGGAGWEQNANAGNDSGNWGRTQQQRVNTLLKRS